MIKYLEKDSCMGCGACYNICPENCISMTDDFEGFLYPKVDEDNCIKCGLCKTVCPAINEYKAKDNYDKPDIYAAWSLDDEVRFNSTSGGIFTELAKSVLSNEGYVVGARYNKNNLVEHYMIDNINDIVLLRQSKYIQSNKGLIFRKTKKALQSGKKVLFVGAPCEIAALGNFIDKEYENLVICDFICRGANSPKVYTKYLESLEKEFGSSVKRVWFKNKTYGWNRFSTKVKFNNGKEYIKDRYNDYFMKGYIEYNMYMRSCCENCKYKGIPRKSDITLADFWGIGTVDSSLDSDKGTSLVMINSKKGADLFQSISKNVFVSKRTLKDAISGNICILDSVKLNPNRNEFFSKIDKVPFDELIKPYIQMTFKQRIVRKFSRIISLKYRKIKKKIN